MGEISDALRRARQEGGVPARPRPPERPLERPQERQAGRPSEPEAVAELAVPEARDEGPPPVPLGEGRTPGWQARAVALPDERGVAERFRQLAVRVEQQLAARRTRTLIVCSAERQEGKTLTSCNLSLALSSLGAGRRVALVDLDLHKPSVARCLGIQPRTGLEEALAHGAPLDAVRVPTDFGSLDVYPTARPQHNAHSLLSPESLDRLIHHLDARYTTVVLDTPPILPVTDVALIAPHVGASLLVARSGSTRRKAIQDALRSLPSGHPIGVFLNDAPTRHGRAYHDYYGGDVEVERPEEARDG